jgi:hypothetical protein
MQRDDGAGVGGVGIAINLNQPLHSPIVVEGAGGTQVSVSGYDPFSVAAHSYPLPFSMANLPVTVASLSPSPLAPMNQDTYQMGQRHDQDNYRTGADITVPNRAQYVPSNLPISANNNTSISISVDSTQGGR